MAIIQEIYEWSKGLAAWQQDAIARLYRDCTLDALIWMTSMLWSRQNLLGNSALIAAIKA